MQLRPIALGCAIAAALLTGCATTNPMTPQGPSSSQTPYLIGQGGWNTTAILTVGDRVGGYRMAGIADGMGAYLNEKNELVLLINHELGNNAGVVRAHGEKGSFISEWRIDPATLKVLGGRDLIRKTHLLPGATASLGRMCSADLPAITAFFNAATGKGTQNRIFMNGEENGPAGRVLAHIATGPEAGQSYEIPAMFKASWENVLANPLAQDKTIMIGLDDTHPKSKASSKANNEAGKLYVYVGNKQNTGNDIDKAGLTNGQTYTIRVGTGGLESRATPLTGKFDLVREGGTNFLRPEDGVWDNNNPNVFYFQTTDRISTAVDADGVGTTRLYKLTFADIRNPMAGGSIESMLTGQSGYEMLDNLTMAGDGSLILQEDVGDNPRLGKVWHFDPRTKKLTEIAAHDPARFTKGAPGFLTEDEESSGVIDVTDLLAKTSPRFADGRRHFLINVQAHYETEAELGEGGQLVLLSSPAKK